MDLDRKVVVVTGGTGALGWAIVQELLERSARVVIVARQRRRFDARVGDPAGNGAARQPRFESVDLRHPARVDAVIDRVRESEGGIDVLIHAAGTPPGPPRPFAQYTAQEFEETWRANVTTAFLVGRKMLSDASPDCPGNLLFVGSRLVGCVDHPLLAVHLACRSAVMNLASSIAREESRSGLRCNVVAPGLLDVPANRRAFPDLDQGIWSKPSDAARCAVLLGSDEAGRINGAVVPV